MKIITRRWRSFQRQRKNPKRQLTPTFKPYDNRQIQVIYGSEENYVYAVGDEKEPRFDFLIPYGSYIQEQKRKYKKDIKNAKNWTYLEQDDCFICPSGSKVTFRKYQNKKNRSGMCKTSKYTNVKIVQVAH
jgi:hypothetical protein